MDEYRMSDYDNFSSMHKIVEGCFSLETVSDPEKFQLLINSINEIGLRIKKRTLKNKKIINISEIERIRQECIEAGAKAFMEGFEDENPT